MALAARPASSPGSAPASRLLAAENWESIQRPLARLRVAVDQAHVELLCLRRAYAQILERDADVDQAEPSTYLAVQLTGQERRVASLVAHGRSNREIAGVRQVSVNTVKTQVKSILRKLGVRSRWQVAGALKDPGSS